MVRVPNPLDLEALPLPMPNQRRYAPSFDYLVIGAGIVGLTVAREIAQRGMGSVAVLEKESHQVAHDTDGHRSKTLDQVS